MFTCLVVSGSVLATLVGGVFYAFSTFVMRALAEQPAAAGVAAMQRINITVINPLFLGPFFGAAVLLGIAACMAQMAGQAQAFAWLAMAFGIYTVGSIGVTVRCHVPRNNRLAVLASTSGAAVSYWPRYVRQWTFWNHVRFAACMAAGVMAVVGLVIGDHA